MGKGADQWRWGVIRRFYVGNREFPKRLAARCRAGSLWLPRPDAGILRASRGQCK